MYAGKLGKEQLYASDLGYKKGKMKLGKGKKAESNEERVYASKIDHLGRKKNDEEVYYENRKNYRIDHVKEKKKNCASGDQTCFVGPMDAEWRYPKVMGTVRRPRSRKFHGNVVLDS